MEDTVVSAGVRAAAGVALALGLLLAGLLADWLLRDGRTGGEGRTGHGLGAPPPEGPAAGTRRGLLLGVWTGVALAALLVAGESSPDPVRQAVSYAGYLAFYAAGLLVLGPLLRGRAARRGQR